MSRLQSTWDVILLVALIAAVPAGIFHLVQGRYGQVVIAIAYLAVGGYLLLRGPRLSESVVHDAIKRRLQREARHDADQIRVSVDHGTVHLMGTVRSLAERDEAEEAARAMPGVVAVSNEIRVDRI